MPIFSSHALLLTFGILGNILSLMVYLSPLPTFRRIVKKKSTEEFQSVPYVVALFSSMLWIYYAILKLNATLVITINSVGCVIETIYIVVYLAYAHKRQRIQTSKLVLIGICGFCSILLPTQFLAKGSKRVKILGWSCIAFSSSVYIAPLGVMKKVISTKSVEFMPFWLSFFLGLSATMWLFYGLLLKDLYITVPNIAGLVFAVLQMTLYIIYKHFIKNEEEQKLPINIMPSISKTNEIHPIQNAHDHENIDSNTTCLNEIINSNTACLNEITDFNTTCRNDHENHINVVNQVPMITA